MDKCNIWICGVGRMNSFMQKSTCFLGEKRVPKQEQVFIDKTTQTNGSIISKGRMQTKLIFFICRFFSFLIFCFLFFFCCFFFKKYLCLWLMAVSVNFNCCCCCCCGKDRCCTDPTVNWLECIKYNLDYIQSRTIVRFVRLKMHPIHLPSSLTHIVI